ncbi:hypothetical protein pdam_00001621 [Pocillopora damicornis]|uniref:Uncharacterized protein n=1 Tax=Pocillopora damicornis TaxID=46731 RepID=A0A3M6U5E1_POCDA|nr:hypothetical protein pdam_00001621 [Pocillopora damicornis]
MRGGSLRRFKVYVPNEQGSDALMRWQTPSPYAIPPFIGIGGFKGGFKRAVKNKSLLEFPRGVKRGANQALKNVVQQKFAKKLDDIFGE